MNLWDSCPTQFPPFLWDDFIPFPFSFNYVFCPGLLLYDSFHKHYMDGFPIKLDKLTSALGIMWIN